VARARTADAATARAATARGRTAVDGEPPAVELRGIDKRFGRVHANRGVSLAVPKGTIHGIVGENGAGKSTLMNILYGYYRADAGEIRIGGRPVAVGSPQDAIRAGIGMVHQHFMLVEPFTVLENVLLGAEGGATLAAGKARAREELRRLERGYALEVDVDATVGELPVGLQQRVEILKALFRGAEILVLDEPTGVLTPQEADHLFRILRVLRDEGRTVILITHKLREIMAATDNVTVMRRGEVVATLPTAETSREELAELMVGRKVLLRTDKAPARPGAVVLEVARLDVDDEAGVHRVRGASFVVRAGEIVGIAGVAGNGQSELLEALAGIRPVAGGRIVIKGRDVTAAAAAERTPAALHRLGVAHAPEDRQRMGLVVEFPAYENAVLGYQGDSAYRRGPLLDRGRMIASCGAWMRAHDVRPPDPLLKASAFSGGNQQKLVLAREIEHDPDLLLVGQPTRGVDIGAIEFIHRRIVAMRDAGKAILLVSVELDEILALADRILVMFDGRIVDEVPREEATERQLGLMMAGVEAGVEGRA
jgi:general nucleoside transport system ATP-binding protein